LHRPATWVPGAKPPSTARNYDPNPVIRRSTTSILHPMRVTHAVLACADYRAMATFYTEVAGFDVVHRGPNDGYVYLKGAASHFDVVLFPAGNLAPGLHHAAFEVWPDEDLATAAKALAAKGIRVVSDLDLRHKRSLCILDPSGLKLEFYVRRAADFGDVARASGEARLFAA
jgi:catechol 2,3-dioxygenase